MLQDGTILGSYVIDGYVASGGMGVVYRAQHRVLRQTVALKVLQEMYARNPKIRQRFEQEAMLQANLQHPNIVRVTDFLTTDVYVALVMDFVAGPSLDQVLEEEQPGPWAEADWLPMFTRVVSAVAYAHAAGVVHRDIKPGNVLLDRANGRPGLPRIADFGIAKIVSGSAPAATRAGSRMGTVPYMAPEQFRGDIDVGPTADVYALGMLAWRLAAGALPVNPDDMVAATELYTGRRQVPSFTGMAPGLAPDLARVMDSCLSLTPTARPADAGVLLRSLGQRGPATDSPTLGLPTEPAGARRPRADVEHTQLSTDRSLQPEQRANKTGARIAAANRRYLLAGIVVLGSIVWGSGPSRLVRSDCDAARENVLRIRQSEATTPTSTSASAALAGESEAARAIDGCEQLSPQSIRCIMSAANVDALAACSPSSASVAAPPAGPRETRVASSAERVPPNPTVEAAPPVQPTAGPVAPATDDSVDCEKAVDHMIELITDDATIPADKKAEALAQSRTPEGRAKAVEGCKAAPTAITSCMLVARDLKTAIGCQLDANDAPPPLPSTAVPPTATAAAADECSKAVDHMMALLEKDRSVPADSKAAMLKSVRSAEGRKNAVDSCGKETPATIRCVLAATEFKAAAECGTKK